MCLAIWRPATNGRGSNITNRTIDLAFTRHPDGFGVVTRADGKLKVERFIPGERRAFRRALRRADAAGVEYAAHWRLATSGPTDREHSHPFVYTDPAGFEVAVLHNGIINIAHDRSSTSDTATFVQKVLAFMPSRWWEQSAMRYLVTEAIGWSKLIIFPAVGEVTLINEGDGEWDGGIWYSSNHRGAIQAVQAPIGPKGGVYAVTASQAKGASEAYKVLTGKAAPVPAPAAQMSIKVPAKTPETAYLADKGARDSYPNLRHAGHVLTSLLPMNPNKDGDYANAVECESCGTLGHVYAIDGSFYVDIHHRAPVTSAVEERVFADALPF